jgi:hypothetical protein
LFNQSRRRRLDFEPDCGPTNQAPRSLEHEGHESVQNGAVVHGARQVDGMLMIVIRPNPIVSAAHFTFCDHSSHQDYDTSLDPPLFPKAITLVRLEPFRRPTVLADTERPIVFIWNDGSTLDTVSPFQGHNGMPGLVVSGRPELLQLSLCLSHDLPHAHGGPQRPVDQKPIDNPRRNMPLARRDESSRIKPRSPNDAYTPGQPSPHRHGSFADVSRPLSESRSNLHKRKLVQSAQRLDSFRRRFASGHREAAKVVD